ncbi:hypothetical protein [Dyadobacter sp. CY312]|uniref:LPD3 domain-containing protein n=1 Tax=Dyadobacter sp. CY312 TaxID=2907303 RepID=UPI001F2B4104|nr:hypothetical protein [Dyadobacter sp. CY312]MCE7039236.1 hypothetical protein [Dyadobacter sp. CY312]
MGKQQTESQGYDYFGNIKSVNVPDDVKRVMSQRGIDPAKWQSELNERISIGGETKADAIQKAFTMFDQVGGTTKYKSILDDVNRSIQSRQQDISDRRETRIQNVEVSENPSIQQQAPAKNVSTIKEDRSSYTRAFLAPLYNSILNLAEGTGKVIVDIATTGDKLGELIPGENEELLNNAKTANVRKAVADKKISAFFDGIKAEVDKETSRNPISFENEKGEFELSFDSDPKKWMAGVGGGLGSMLSLLAPNKKVGFLMNFSQMYSQNSDEASKAGLTGMEAIAYSTGTSLVQGALEMVGDIGILNSLKGKAGKEVIKRVAADKSARAISELAKKGITREVFEDVVTKTFKETVDELKDKSTVAAYKAVVKNGMKKAAQAGGTEMATEFLQEWASYGGQRGYNAISTADGTLEGNGQFQTNALETLGNATYGALLGGFLGGVIGQFAPNSKELNETLGAYINADIKEQLTANPSITLDELKTSSRVNKLMEVATRNGQFNNSQGQFDQEKFNAVQNKASQLYDTFFDFKDLPGFSAEDRLAMFHVTDTRNQNSEKLGAITQAISGIGEIQSEIDNLISSGGSPVAITKLEVTKAQMADGLGEMNTISGKYAAQEEVEANILSTENVIKQAIPEISSTDNARKKIGRDFLSSNFFPESEFEPTIETTLSDGTVVFKDENNNSVKKLIVTPNPNQVSVSQQLSAGKDYTPVERDLYDIKPIDDLRLFKETASNLQSGATTTARDISQPFSLSLDSIDLIDETKAFVVAASSDPAMAADLETQLGSNLDFYNQIASQPGAAAEGILPMTRDQFNAAVGLAPISTQLDTQSSTQPEIKDQGDVDPQEGTILAQQEKLNRPFSVENEYSASDSSIETIEYIEQGEQNLDPVRIDSAISELLGLRKKWQSTRKSNKREYTLSQIDDMIAAIEKDLTILADEKSYQEAPELRPSKENLKNDSEELTSSENQQTKNEDTDGQGTDDSTEEPYSVESEYTEERQRGEVISDIEAKEAEVRRGSGLSEHGSEQTSESDESTESVTGLTDTIIGRLGELAQGHGQREKAISNLYEETDVQPNDGSDGQERTAETEGDLEKPVTEVKSKQKGIRKDKRKIKDPERLQALAKFPANIYEEVYQYFVSNGQVNTKDVNTLFKGTGNTERQNMVSSTADYGLTVDELAHKLWEETNFGEQFQTSDYKDAIEETILSYPGLKELTDRLNALPEEAVDPDFVPDENNTNPDDIEEDEFLKNVRKSNEDPDYVPFSRTTAGQTDPETTRRVLAQIAKAFPKIKVNIAQTQQEYLDNLNSIPTARQVFTKDNLPYGYINPVDGSINLNPETLNTNTAIHEFGHIWNMWAKMNNPELHAKGMALVRDSSYFKRLQNDPNYQGLTQEQLLDEALATAIGDKGESFVTPTRKKSFKDWMFQLFDNIKDYLGFRKLTSQQIAELTLDEFTSGVVSELLSGETISQINSDDILNILSENLIEKGLEQNLSSKNTPVLEVKTTFKNIADAKDFAKENLIGKGFSNKDTGEIITVSRTSIDKSLSASALGKSVSHKLHINSISVLPELLQNSVLGESYADRSGDGNIPLIQRLYGAIKSNDDIYRVKTTVKTVLKEGDRFYTYEVQDIELIAERRNQNRKEDRTNLASPLMPSNSISSSDIDPELERRNQNRKEGALSGGQPTNNPESISMTKLLEGALKNNGEPFFSNTDPDNQNIESDSQSNTSGIGDILFHHTPTVFAAPGSGETIGTNTELQNAARKELINAGVFRKLEKDKIKKTVTGGAVTTTIVEKGLSKADQKIINEIAERYGWKYIGAKFETVVDPITGVKSQVRNDDVWTRDISKENNSFFTGDGKMVLIPLKGKSGKHGRVSETILQTEQWLEKLRSTGNVFYKAAQWLIDSGFDRLNNIETFVKTIDGKDGLLKSLIHDVKRAASDNRNHAMNIMGRVYEDVRRDLGKYSIHKDASTLETAEKLPVSVIQWDRSKGSSVTRNVSLPISVVMDIVANHQSQRSMGDAYNTKKVKDSSGVERVENHTSAVIDSQYDIDPDDSTLFWKNEGKVESVHKGVHFKKDVMMEANSKGELELVKDGKQYGLFHQSEMDRMEDYLMSSGPADVRAAYKKVRAAFNDKAVRDMIQKENDESINPDTPFVVINDYSPIQTVSNVSAQNRVNAFSPNLEDAKLLNERTARPDAIYGSDVLDSFDYYKESVSHILGSTKLVHNLKNLQQSIITDYDGKMKTRLNDILNGTIENLQNYRQSQFDISKNEEVLRPLLYLMHKYTGNIFRSNLGISTKQIGTWFSAMGLGYIDNKYMFGNRKIWSTMANLSFRGSTSDRLAGGTIVEATGKGLKIPGGFDTAEAGLIRDLLGEGLTGDKLDNHRKRWATVIQRTIYGQSQYTETGNLGSLRFTSAGRKRVKQIWNYFDSMFEEYGMANIRRLDRAVILGYKVAAEQQALDELRPGESITDDHIQDKIAKAVTETLYLTNQMSDPADLTMMQRNPSFGNKVLAMYSGQTQKLWNQLSGATIEYYKYKDTASAADKKLLQNRMTGALVSNLLINTMWMASANMGVSVLRGWLAGEEDKEEGYYQEKFMWDVARYGTGLAPGLFSQVAQYMISTIDNEQWTDEIFDIPGSDVIVQAWSLTQGIYGLTSNIWDDKSEKENDKNISDAVYNFSKVFGVFGGPPKTWTDPIVKRIKNGLKPPKGLKASDITLDEDLDFEEEFEDDEFYDDDFED